jgi:ubiquinone/menaquinone biosynthesis C-methylase UbiE
MPSMSGVEKAFCRSGPWQSFTRRVVLPWAMQSIHPHGALLELGGGSGAMAQETLRRFPDLRLTVTDIDPAMVTAARRRLGQTANAAVEEADMTDLPFADESFDVVASYLMLHHVINWKQAVSEAARVLRPGGILIGYDLADTRLAEWIHWADRSPHQLIASEKFAPALTEAGLDAVNVRQALGRHVVRFAARKPA